MKSWKELDLFSKADDPDVVQVRTTAGAVGASFCKFSRLFAS